MSAVPWFELQASIPGLLQRCRAFIRVGVGWFVDIRLGLFRLARKIDFSSFKSDVG